MEQYMTMLSALPPSLSTSCDVRFIAITFGDTFMLIALQALNKVISEIDAKSDVSTFISNNR